MAPVAPPQSVVVLTPTDDSYVAAGANTGSGFGAASGLTVGTSATATHDGTSVALLRFAVPARDRRSTCAFGARTRGGAGLVRACAHVAAQAVAAPTAVLLELTVSSPPTAPMLMSVIGCGCTSGAAAPAWSEGACPRRIFYPKHLTVKSRRHCEVVHRRVRDQLDRFHEHGNNIGVRPRVGGVRAPSQPARAALHNAGGPELRHHQRLQRRCGSRDGAADRRGGHREARPRYRGARAQLRPAAKAGVTRGSLFSRDVRDLAACARSTSRAVPAVVQRSRSCAACATTWCVDARARCLLPLTSVRLHVCCADHGRERRQHSCGHALWRRNRHLPVQGGRRCWFGSRVRCAPGIARHATSAAQLQRTAAWSRPCAGRHQRCAC